MRTANPALVAAHFSRALERQPPPAPLAVPALAAEEQASEPVVAGKTTITLDVNGKAAEGRGRAAHHAARSAPLRLEPDRRQADQRRWLERRQHGAGRRQADERQHACLALQCVGKPIQTVESLGGAKVDPVPAAFVHHDASQCGFCTPGFVMAVQGVPGQESQGDRSRDSRRASTAICAAAAPMPTSFRRFSTS